MYQPNTTGQTGVAGTRQLLCVLRKLLSTKCHPLNLLKSKSLTEMENSDT